MHEYSFASQKASKYDVELTLSSNDDMNFQNIIIFK